jgi:hypothetical protein
MKGSGQWIVGAVLIVLVCIAAGCTSIRNGGNSAGTEGTEVWWATVSATDTDHDVKALSIDSDGSVEMLFFE